MTHQMPYVTLPPTGARFIVFWTILLATMLPFATSRRSLTVPSVNGFQSDKPEVFTANEAYDLVDPIIGTSRETQGNVVPSASVPFGNMLFVPETFGGAPKCKAPYYYEDEVLRGVRFSHWISGSCTQDYGSFTVMPLLVNITEKGMQSDRMPSEKFSRFSHQDEVLEPARVEVRNLFQGRMNLSFAAMSHSGVIHLRNVEPGEQEFLFIKIVANSRGGNQRNAAPDERFAAVLTHLGLVVEGSVVVRKLYLGNNLPAGFSGHVYLQFPAMPVEFGFIQGGTRVKCSKDMDKRCFSNSSASEFYALYKPTGLFEIIGGVSFVSPKKAAVNLEMEVGKLQDPFDSVVAFARRKWKEQIGKVLVSKENRSRARSFYTAIYRTMLLPRVFSDADGEYPGFANTSRQRVGEGEMFFSDFSTWDTFRALHPLQTVLNPELSAQFGHSLISMGQQGGWLPIFPAWNSYTDEMIGDHAGAILGDFILKGILRGSDVAEAYRLMRKNAMMVPNEDEYNLGHGRRCIKDYLDLGYVPVECVDQQLHRYQQSSRTIEYSIDDAVLASVACSLGPSFRNDCKRFQKRAGNFRNVMDAHSGFVNGRHRNGSFVRTVLDPTKRSLYLTEGTPWQWTLAPMHDILGLLDALDISKQDLLNRIRQFFEQSLDDHGNEPGHHVPFLFNKLKAYNDTQRVVRDIVETQYGEGARGLKGNDDCGQMSAWLVLSMLGFYQVSPHRPEYEMTTPYFHRADIVLDNGNTLTIAKSLPKAVYSTRVTLNGKCMSESVVSYREIMRGGVLFFESAPQTPTRHTFTPGGCIEHDQDYLEERK